MSFCQATNFKTNHTMTAQIYRFHILLGRQHEVFARSRCCRQLVSPYSASSRAYSSSSSEFQGKGHAELYSIYRPKPDETLVSKVVMNYVRKKTGLHSERLGVAVDIGCGSGQATEVVAGYLNKVIGVDASEAQIAEANKANTAGNIEYRPSIHFYFSYKAYSSLKTSWGWNSGWKYMESNPQQVCFTTPFFSSIHPRKGPLSRITKEISTVTAILVENAFFKGHHSFGMEAFRIDAIFLLSCRLEH